MKASGSRAPARVWPGSPTPGMQELQQRRRSAPKGIVPSWPPCLPSRWRGSDGVRRRGRAVVACPQSVRTGGPRWLRKRRGAGGGLPWRLPPGRAWPRCAGGARTRCVSRCGPCGSRWASPGSTRTAGGPTGARWPQRHTALGRRTGTGSRASPAPCGRGASGGCAGRAAVQRPSRGTLWSGDSSSTGMRSGASCNMRSTTLKHPRKSHCGYPGKQGEQPWDVPCHTWRAASSQTRGTGKQTPAARPPECLLATHCAADFGIPDDFTGPGQWWLVWPSSHISDGKSARHLQSMYTVHGALEAL